MTPKPSYASIVKRSLIESRKKTLQILMEKHTREFSNLEKSNQIWLEIVPLMLEIGHLENPHSSTPPTNTREWDRWGIKRDD